VIGTRNEETNEPKMRLKSITAAGLKARNFKHDLAAVNLFIGKNRKGKTARTEAIKILLYGCDPDRGERNTSAIFSGPTVAIAGEFDNGARAYQGWTAKKGGGWSRSKDCVTAFDTPPTLTNVQHYLKLSASDRLTYVLKKANLSIDLKAAVATVKNVKIEENTEETETLLEDLAADLRTIAQESEQAETGAMGFFEAVIEKLADKVSDANKEVKRLTATVEGFVQQAERNQEDPIRPDIEEVLASARKELEKMRAKRNQDLAALEACKARKKLRDDLEAKLKAIPPGEDSGLAAKLEAKKNEITAFETELAALSSRLTEYENRIASRKPYLDKLNKNEYNAEEIARVKAEIAKIEALPHPPVDMAGEARLEELKKLRQDANTKHFNARENIVALENQLKTIAPETCPHCQKQHTGSAENMLREQLAAEQIKQKQSAEILEATEGEFLKLGARLADEKNQRNKYNAAQTELAELRRTLRTLEVSEEDLKIAREFLENVPALPEPPARTEIQSKIEQLRTEARTLKQNLDAQNKNLERITEINAELKANPALEPIDETTITNQVTLEDKKLAVDALEELYKKHVANLADQRREEQTKQELAKAKIEQAVYKAAQVKFTEKRQSLVDQAFKPILEIANQFTQGFMPPIIYRDGELGWFDGGLAPVWVEHTAASGIEEVLVGIGLAIALCQEAPFKCVILGKDEVARFDPENKTKLIQRMISAVGAGLVDQFFGVDTDAEPYKDFAANPEVSVALI
jgi:hypothetical protein